MTGFFSKVYARIKELASNFRNLQTIVEDKGTSF